jgi:hypothetical protein
MERDAPAQRPARGHRRPSRRPVLAIAFASVFLAVFAGFGGIGYAKSAVSNATNGTHITVSGVGGPSVSVGNGATAGSPTHHQYPHFALTCIITPQRDIPVILPVRLVDFLIANGVAHPPPCNVRPHHH